MKAKLYSHGLCVHLTFGLSGQPGGGEFPLAIPLAGIVPRVPGQQLGARGVAVAAAVAEEKRIHIRDDTKSPRPLSQRTRFQGVPAFGASGASQRSVAFQLLNAMPTRLAMVFMFLAVPWAAAGIFNREPPMPSG